MSCLFVVCDCSDRSTCVFVQREKKARKPGTLLLLLSLFDTEKSLFVLMQSSRRPVTQRCSHCDRRSRAVLCDTARSSAGDPVVPRENRQSQRR